MFSLRSSLFISIIDSASLIKLALLFRLKYFYIWLGTKTFASLYYWSHNAGWEKIITSALTFAIMLDIILVDLKKAEDKKYKSN